MLYDLITFLDGLNPWLVFFMALVVLYMFNHLLRFPVNLIHGYPESATSCPNCGRTVSRSALEKQEDKE